MLPLAILAGGSAALFAFYYHQFSLDDAAIYQRLVKNIAYHGRYSYNLDQQVNPGTSTLYPLVLSLFVFLVPHDSLQTLAVWVDSLMLGVGIFALLHFIWRISGSVMATIVASLVTFLVPMTDLFGMEAFLLVLFMCLYIDRFHQDGVRQTIVALFPLVRPEGAVFLGVEALYLWYREHFSPKALRGVVARSVVLALPLMVSCAANLWLFKEIFPHSVGNKLAQGIGGGWQTYGSFLKSLVKESFRSLPSLLLAGCVLIGAAYSIKKRALAVGAFGLAITLWQVGLIVCKAPYYTWYCLPLYFTLFLGACLGIAALQDVLHSILGKRWSNAISWSGAALVLLWAIFKLLPATPLPPETRQAIQRKAAQYISNLHQQGPPARAAALEVGHFGNALDEERFSIYDLCGLTSKNKGFFQPGFYDDFFCHDRPEYLVINYFSAHPTKRESISVAGDGFIQTRHSVSEYHKSVWPHHTGLVLDARFFEAYEYIESVQSPGYGGGLSIFRLRNSFVCPPSALKVQKVKASREHDTSVSAEKVIDGDLRSTWNAGEGKTQWLDFTFPRTESIQRIHLYANQNGTYEFTIRLRFWDDENAQPRALETHVTAADGDMLEVTLDNPQMARRIELETVHGRRSVAWREVRFYASTKTEAFSEEATGGSRTGMRFQNSN